MNPESNPEADNEHGGAPILLPHWIQDRWSVLKVTVVGVALIVGFFGEQFLGLPSAVVLAFYLLACLAGGYDVVRVSRASVRIIRQNLVIALGVHRGGAERPGLLAWHEPAEDLNPTT